MIPLFYAIGHFVSKERKTLRSEGARTRSGSMLQEAAASCAEMCLRNIHCSLEIGSLHGAAQVSVLRRNVDSGGQTWNQEQQK